MSLLPQVSTSYAHLLLEAIATDFGARPYIIHSSTAWVLLARLDLQTSEDRPQLFLNLTLSTCDDNYGCRFPRPALQYALFASHLISLRSPLSSNPSYYLQLILCSWQTALCLRTGYIHGINRLSLVFSFLSACSTRHPGRGPSPISPAPAPLQGPMRAPDSRPSILVSPAATGAAYGTVALISQVSTGARLSSCSPFGRYLRLVESHLRYWDPQCPQATDEPCHTAGASRQPWTT